MCSTHRHRRLTATLLTTVLLVETTGCSAWRTVPAPAAQALAEHPDADLRLLLHTDLVIELGHGKVSADSVAGVLHKVRIASRPADSSQVGAVLRRFGVPGAVDSVVVVPLDAVRRVERRSESVGPLGILILAAGGVAAIIACAVQSCVPNLGGGR